MNRPLAALALVSALGLSACGGSSGSTSALPAAAVAGADRQVRDVLGGLSNVTAFLFDAPLNVANLKVEVALTSLQAVRADGSTYTMVAFAAPKVVDLLHLKDAALQLDGAVPAGSYTALRFVFDRSQSYIAIGPFQYPLSSWQQTSHPAWQPNGLGGTLSGSLVAVDAPVAFSADGVNKVDLTADFNVLESLVIGKRGATINPRLVAAKSAAVLKGKVVNALGVPVINATIQAFDDKGKIVNTTSTGSGGDFTLRALKAGHYRIVVSNAYVSTAGNTLTAVNADAGSSPAVQVDLTAGTQIELPQITD